MEAVTKNRQSREVLLQMVQKAFGNETGIKTLKELPEGFCNIAYRILLSDGRETILKISPDQKIRLMTCETELMRTEVAAMGLAREKQLADVAEAYYYDDSRTLCSGEYFFMEVLRGQGYHTVKESMTQEEQAAVDVQTGALLYRLHQEKGCRFGHFCVPGLQFASWYEAFFSMLSGVLEDGKRAGVAIGIPYEEITDKVVAYRQYFQEVREPSFVHYDSWEGNIFIENGEITGFIDWERAMWADPLMEDRFRSHSVNSFILKGYGICELTKAQKIRCLWYDSYLYLIMMIEGSYRQYETDDQYRWAQDQFRQAWNKLK